MQTFRPNSMKLALHIIDPCSSQRAAIAQCVYALGHHAEVYAELSELTALRPRSGLIIARDDTRMGGVSAITNQLLKIGVWLPLIATDENPEPSRIVDAIKAGALDYISLPIDQSQIERILERVSKEAETTAIRRRRLIEARDRISTLSGREREVLELLSEGGSNKEIARELEISPRTVEIHRSNMMGKLGARHAAEAVRFRLEADMTSASIN